MTTKGYTLPSVRRLITWTRRHPEIKATDINPADTPEDLRGAEKLSNICVNGCLFLEDTNVPRGKFWPVPGRHGRDMCRCYRMLAQFRAFKSLLAVCSTQVDRLTDDT